MSERRRLFLALWPDEEVRGRIEALAAERLKHIQGRGIKGDNMHLTLAFLGYLDEDKARCIEEGIAGIRGEPFTLVLDQMGYWKRPRVVWVGASRIPEPLERLVEAIKGVMKGCGLEVERRPFRAHLTLARKAQNGPLIPEPIEPIPWAVKSFCLVESRLTPKGAEYTVLRTFPLAENG